MWQYWVLTDPSIVLALNITLNDEIMGNFTYGFHSSSNRNLRIGRAEQECQQEQAKRPVPQCKRNKILKIELHLVKRFSIQNHTFWPYFYIRPPLLWAPSLSWDIREVVDKMPGHTLLFPRDEFSEKKKTAQVTFLQSLAGLLPEIHAVLWLVNFNNEFVYHLRTGLGIISRWDQFTVSGPFWCTLYVRGETKKRITEDKTYVPWVLEFCSARIPSRLLPSSSQGNTSNRL